MGEADHSPGIVVAMRTKKWAEDEAFNRERIGRSTVTASNNINLPKSVRENYGIKPGDALDWFPGTANFPEALIPDLLGIVVRRKG